MQNFNILELGGISQGQLAFAIRVDQQLGTEFLLGLFDAVQTFDDGGRQFLEGHVQSLFLPNHAKNVVVTSTIL